MKDHFKKLDDFARGAKEEVVRFVDGKREPLTGSKIKSREIHYGIEDINDAAHLKEAMNRMVESLIFEDRLPTGTIAKKLTNDPHAYRVGDIIIRIFEVK